MAEREHKEEYIEEEVDFEEDYMGIQLTSTMQEALEEESPLDLEKNDGLFEVDFDEELGGSEIITTQDMIDREYQDIAKLNVVQVVGDDRFGKKVIVFYACRLPPTSELDLNRLWQYVVSTMKQFVSNDYSLIYFHHGLNSKNNPGLKFLLNAYKQIDRDFKKNLKNLFIVHPTNLLKIIISTLLPFFSAKVKRKIVKVHHLKDLESNFYVDQMTIPALVRNYDNQLELSSRRGSQFYSSQLSENAVSFPTYPFVTQFQKLPESQFGVSLQHIRQYHQNSKVPPVLEDCVQYLSKTECLQCVGLFRRSPVKVKLEETQKLIDTGVKIDFETIDGAPHLAAGLIKTFLRNLEEPLMTFELYDNIVQIHNCKQDIAIENIRMIVSEMLPDYNYTILKYLVDFLVLVASYSDQNLMNTQNLANVFAPNLIWSRNEVSMTVIHIFIQFTNILLQHHTQIFQRNID